MTRDDFEMLMRVPERTVPKWVAEDGTEYTWCLPHGHFTTIVEMLVKNPGEENQCLKALLVATDMEELCAISDALYNERPWSARVKKTIHIALTSKETAVVGVKFGVGAPTPYVTFLY